MMLAVGHERGLATVSERVYFGTEQVSPAEKTRRVGGVFDAVVERYDLMNDIMSLGSHRLMKRAAVEMARLRPGQRVLDLAGGTGDVAALAAPLVAEGSVVLADINRSMMDAGRDRLLDKGHAHIAFAQADAALLPFAENSFDAILVAFGVRNFASTGDALREMLRVLRDGGTVVVLEFSKVANPILACAYGAFKATWPSIGKAVVGSAEPYRYLVDSIERHPEQDAFEDMMATAGFKDVRHSNLLGGAAAIHRGTK